MDLEPRIRAIEAQHRQRAEADAPPQRQHADRDECGNVIACERLTWPTIRQQKEWGMTMADAMRLIQREPFSRESCPYSDCEYRASCRADGALTKWAPL